MKTTYIGRREQKNIKGFHNENDNNKMKCQGKYYANFLLFCFTLSIIN